MFEHIVVVLRSRTLICNSYCYVVLTADLFEFVFLEKKIYASRVLLSR